VAHARREESDVVAAYRGAAGKHEISLDVCDAANVEAAFRIVQPTLVIHCASYGVNYADQDPNTAIAVNIHGGLCVLAAAARHGVGRFVHVGTAFEYGSHEGRISEDVPLNPTAQYGATKAAGTILLRERARTLGVPLIVVRPFGIWGPGEPAYHLVPQVIMACVNRYPLKLTPCEILRDYMYVEDVADRILALARIPSVSPEMIVNIGSGEGSLLRDFVLSIARLLDGEVFMKFGQLQYRPTEMASLIPDVRRLKSLIGDRHQISLREGVRRVVNSMGPPMRTINSLSRS